MIHNEIKAKFLNKNNNKYNFPNYYLYKKKKKKLKLIKFTQTFDICFL